MASRWIVGRGLLGRAVERTRHDDPFRCAVPWADPDAAVAQLADGLRAFAARPGRLELYWCAGRGVTSTPADVLAVEVETFSRFLAVVAAAPADVRERLTFFLASSAGGAFAGSSAPPFRETTPPVPTSAYGRAKLAMEEALRTHTHTGGWRSVVGRLSNLYGPGQDPGKGQGLISVLVDSDLTGRPASIYVPLDTLRDYLFEDDAAAMVDAAVRRAGDLPPGQTVVKIFANGNAVSIGALLGELTRLRRRRGRYVLGQGDATGQALDLRVRSDVWTDLDEHARTTLPEGLGRIFQGALTRRQGGR